MNILVLQQVGVSLLRCSLCGAHVSDGLEVRCWNYRMSTGAGSLHLLQVSHQIREAEKKIISNFKQKS